VIAPLLLAAGWLAMAAEPVKDEPADEPSIITDVSVDKKICNARNARRVELADLASEPRELLGRCVQVRGYLHGRALFLTRADARLRYSQSTDSLDGRRVGLYGLEKASPAGPPQPGFYRIVGLAGDCERLAQGSLMVMGYCHYTGGPYIAVSEVRRGR
jgi:hypothetical protein